MNHEDLNTFENDEIHPGILWATLHKTANCGYAAPVTEVGVPLDEVDDVSTLYGPHSVFFTETPLQDKRDEDKVEEEEDNGVSELDPEDAASGIFTKKSRDEDKAEEEDDGVSELDLEDTVSGIFTKNTQPTKTLQDIEQPAPGSQATSTEMSSVGNTDSNGSPESKLFIKPSWKWTGLILVCAAGAMAVILFLTGVFNQDDKNGGNSSSSPETVSGESRNYPQASSSPTRSPVVTDAPSFSPTVIKTVASQDCPSCGSTRCGITWTDANTRCGPSCASWPDPAWDTCSPCPDGEACFADLSVHCCPASAPPPAPTPQNSSAATSLPGPTASPSPTVTLCSTTRCRPSSSTSPSSLSSIRCGTSWTDANTNCKTTCAAPPNPGWDACPSGELCYADLDTSQCST